MKLSKRIQNNISKELTIRVNELYHDLEHKYYQERQSGMFSKEKIKWEELSEEYIKSNKEITCLDYGTGTGFVPLVIGHKLKNNDTLFCADLSKIILDVCKLNIKNTGFIFNQKYVKIDGVNIPLKDNSIDVITINSVLHHIYDLPKFSEEIYRCLKPKGLLIIVHEPNAETKLPFFTQFFINTLEFISSPQNLIFFLTEKFAFIELLLRKILNKISASYRKRNTMLEEISEILISERLINFKLRGTEIQQLVDIHTDKGFTKNSILKIFNKFELKEWKTYDFISEKNKILRKINDNLEKKYPLKGKTLLFVLKKGNE